MLGGKFNIGKILKSAKSMQEMMAKAQAELEKIVVTGESGAGAVKVTLTARHYAKRVDIDSEILKEDKAVIEDLIAAAINDATGKVEEATKSKMMDSSQLFGDIDLDIDALKDPETPHSDNDE